MDPKDIQIVIFDGLPVEPLCKAWAESLCDTKLASDIWKCRPILSDLAVLRNRLCDWFLKKTDKKALLFLEHSKIPDNDTLPVLVSDADIVAAEYCSSKHEKVHDENGCVGTGCLRISRVALLKMKTPYFNYVQADDGLSIRKCSCMWFCERAQEAGYHPVTAGRISRMQNIIVTPDGQPRRQDAE